MHDAVMERINETRADHGREPVAELRACLSENATTPEAVPEAAVAEWLAYAEDILLERWKRIGVGFD